MTKNTTFDDKKYPGVIVRNIHLFAEHTDQTK